LINNLIHVLVEEWSYGEEPVVLVKGLLHFEGLFLFSARNASFSDGIVLVVKETILPWTKKIPPQNESILPKTGSVPYQKEALLSQTEPIPSEEELFFFMEGWLSSKKALALFVKELITRGTGSVFGRIK
jgi:hypothetical protein